MNDCLFCKIEQDEIPSERIYEDDQLFAIKDINPQAPTHLLIIPRKHFASILDVKTTDQALIGSIFEVAKKLAYELGLTQSGFRIVLNCGSDGGQTIFHIHFHLLGGRTMGWPPG